MPSLKLAKQFIKACGVPIAAPSANLSGSPSPTSFAHVLKDFAGKIPCIIIGPQSEYGLESTVVDCTAETAEILRPGIITAEELKKAGINVSSSPIKEGKAETARSPGQKYRHYSPKAKVKMISVLKNIKDDSAYIGLASFSEQSKNLKLKRSCRNLYDYAKNLFSFFRECDDKGIKIIYAEKVEEKGIGMAIMNRLKKASS
jgi:L-threonylcarbamoyladenylate synthase